MRFNRLLKISNFSALMAASTALALLILPACTDLTEFDHVLRSGITIIHTPDLSVIHTIDDISGARSLCSLPDCFIVATIEGELICFDLESYQQTGSISIGSPSSSGYFEMEYSPIESSVYIIGALGQIVELHVPDMEIMDSFSVCETPVDIEVCPDTQFPYFYVAGATSCRIYELRQETNGKSRYSLLPSSPTCMAISQSMDTILVGTIAGTNIVSIVPGAMWHRTMNIPRIVAVEHVPTDTTFCAVFSQSSYKSLVTILNYFSTPFSPTPVYTGSVDVDGDFCYMCVNSSGSHAYVLSYLGDSTSRLISYNCSGYFIESQIDFQGYPLDLEISPEGTLLVLTAE